MNQLEYRTQQLVMNVDFLSAAVSQLIKTVFKLSAASGSSNHVQRRDMTPWKRVQGSKFCRRGATALSHHASCYCLCLPAADFLAQIARHPSIANTQINCKRRERRLPLGMQDQLKNSSPQNFETNDEEAKRTSATVGFVGGAGFFGEEGSFGRPWVKNGKDITAGGGRRGRKKHFQE